MCQRTYVYRILHVSETDVVEKRSFIQKHQRTYDSDHYDFIHMLTARTLCQLSKASSSMNICKQLYGVCVIPT